MVVIAVSGQPGCGSSTTAKLLAEKLGLTFHSAGKHFKSHGEGESETEKAVNLLRVRKGQSKEFHSEIDEMQVEWARQGEAVIEGKLAIYFLKGIADFCVWLKADIDVRSQRYSKRDNSSLLIARSYLHEKEKEERELWKRIYGFDYFEQEKSADLIIDTGNILPEEIVGLIIKAMKKKKII